MVDNKDIEEEVIKDEEKIEEQVEEKEEVLEGEVEEGKEEKEGEESLEIKLNRIEEEVEEWKQSYMRKQAEFQNFTKRKETELVELRKYAAEKVILKVLEAVDNLERGVAASSESKDFESLVKGVTMTLNQMNGILEAEGVEAISSNRGDDFDPYIHQGVLTEDDPELEDNKIILELQKGYKLKERVIRPAMVKVCKK